MVCIWACYSGSADGWVECTTEEAATWFAAGCAVRLVRDWRELHLLNLPPSPARAFIAALAA